MISLGRDSAGYPMMITGRALSYSADLTERAMRLLRCATLFLSEELLTALECLIREAIRKFLIQLLRTEVLLPNGTVKSKPVPMHGFDNSICIDIPAFSAMYFTVKKAPERKKTAKKPAKSKSQTKPSVKAEAKKTVKKSAAKIEADKKSKVSAKKKAEK